jgi:hypothetical protein
MTMKLEATWLTIASLAGTGIWGASSLSSQITDNETSIVQIEEKLDDHTDRLARIETKLDILVEEKK